MKNKIAIIALGVLFLMPTSARAQATQDIQIQLVSLMQQVVELQQKLLVQRIQPNGIVAGSYNGGPVQEIELETKTSLTPGYLVQLDTEWEAVSNAVQYQVTHVRKDLVGTATEISMTTGTTATSGPHYNRSAPEVCYDVSTTVEAIDGLGHIIGKGSAAICEIGIPADSQSSQQNAANALSALTSALKALGELVGQ